MVIVATQLSLPSSAFAAAVILVDVIGRAKMLLTVNDASGGCVLATPEKRTEPLRVKETDHGLPMTIGISDAFALCLTWKAT